MIKSHCNDRVATKSKMQLFFTILTKCDKNRKLNLNLFKRFVIRVILNSYRANKMCASF